MSSEPAGPCMGGPHDGEFRSYGSDDMPVLAQGADTEGDLLGYYRFNDGAWHWVPDAPLRDGERTR